MKKTTKDYFIILIGGILYSVAIAGFIIPSSIGAGGVTGIALAVNHIFKIKIGYLSLLVNIPLFIFGYKIIGRKFAVRSCITVIATSLLTDFITEYLIFAPMEDKLLSAIFAGLILGVAFYLLFVSNSSTGGLDISAKIIQSKFKEINISAVLLIQDFLVYGLVALTLGVESVMYAIIMSYIRSKTMDVIEEYMTASKQCIIISNNYSSIISDINLKLNRSATILKAEGGYSKNDKIFIYVIVGRNQLSQLKYIVNSIDSSAFYTISPVNAVVGNYSQPMKI